MKKPVLLIFVNAMILIVVFALLAQSLLIVQRIAQAGDVSGIVEVQRRGKGEFKLLANDQTVAVGDVVRTGANGHVEFTWADQTRWRLMPGSQLTVANATINAAKRSENARFRLDEGKLFVRIVKPIQAGSSFEVSTPSATAKVTGTVFSIEVQPGGSTCVESYAGQVQMESAGHNAVVMAGTAGVSGPDSIDMMPMSGADFRAQPDLIRPNLSARAQALKGAAAFVTGSTEASNLVEINGKRALVLGNGGFGRRYTLEPGINQWTIVATDKHGAKSQVCRALNYDANAGATRVAACE